jgi:hypothetical protein
MPVNERMVVVMVEVEDLLEYEPWSNAPVYFKHEAKPMLLHLSC